eukprot:Nk52_evm69s914 gene=Nk52_evmTU69s914
MAMNFAATTPEGGLVSLPNERIIFSEKAVEFSMESPGPMLSSKGFIYISDQRIVFVSHPQSNDPNAFQNFTFPLYLVRDASLKQPIFGSNYFTGFVDPLPDGGLISSSPFKFVFSEGGATEFATQYLRVSEAVHRGPASAYVSQPHVAPQGFFTVGNTMEGPPPPMYAESFCHGSGPSGQASAAEAKRIEAEGKQGPSSNPPMAPPPEYAHPTPPPMPMSSQPPQPSQDANATGAAPPPPSYESSFNH